MTELTTRVCDVGQLRCAWISCVVHVSCQVSESMNDAQQKQSADVAHSDVEQPTHSQAAEDVHSSVDEAVGLETLAELTD